MKNMKSPWSLCVFVLLAGALHQASAARQLSAANPLQADSKQFLPHKDAKGAWQPANLTGIDFNTLTLADLPTTAKFLEIAMTSPYPMPNIPLMLLVNNTFKELNGGTIPASVDEWARLLLAEGTSKQVANLSHLLVKYLPNITLPDGKVLSVGEKASKALTTVISDVTGGWQAGTMAEFASSGAVMDAMSSRMAPVAPANFLQGINPTLNVEKGLPNLIRQVAQNVGHAIEEMEMPDIEGVLKEDGTLDVPGILKSTLNLQANLPTVLAMPAMQTRTPQIPTKTIVEITKALPAMGDRLGLNTTAIKFPNATAVESALQKASGKDIFVTDRYGRMDLLATITQLPQKVPELNKVAQAVEAAAKPPQGWPDLEEVAGAVVRMALPKPSSDKGPVM